MTTIQVRIDTRTKQSAKKVLDDIGIDMSSAIKLYLKQIGRIKGIPFPLLTANGLTPEQEMAIMEASVQAKRGANVTPRLSTQQAIDYLLEL